MDDPSSANGPSSVLDAIWRQINEVDEQDLELVAVRVTTDALPGSPVALPVTPERARVIGRLYALPDGVVADPGWYERRRELLMHPEDFMEVRKSLDPMMAYTMPVAPGDPELIFGVPVER